MKHLGMFSVLPTHLSSAHELFYAGLLLTCFSEFLPQPDDKPLRGGAIESHLLSQHSPGPGLGWEPVLRQDLANTLMLGESGSWRWE